MRENEKLCVKLKLTFQWQAFASLKAAKEPLKTPVLRKLEREKKITHDIILYYHTINTKLMCSLASFKFS